MGALRTAESKGINSVVSESPTSVYLARPGEDFQVEVFDPDPETALEVALSPALQPVPAD